MDLNKIEKLYSENIEKFGINSKSVGWSTPESQNLRFQKLLYVVIDSSNSLSVNELGCGYGEFYKYLQIKDLQVSSFNGYDISEKMLEAARGYVSDVSDIELIQESKLKTYADYSFTSGIFNVKFEESSKAWEGYIQDIIYNMFEFSNKGIAFNLLSSYVDFKEDHLYYGDPAYFFDFCKRKLSKYVTLLHDYPLFEWTICVNKQ